MPQEALLDEWEGDREKDLAAGIIRFELQRGAAVQPQLSHSTVVAPGLLAARSCPELFASVGVCALACDIVKCLHAACVAVV